MRLLVTRPREDAEPLAEALRAIGVEPVLAPLMTIEPVQGAKADLTGVQALLFTSANGVRAFARLSAERALPVLAVGDATARVAAATGFTGIESAGGDASDLAALAERRLDPTAGALFHAAGRDVAGPMKTALEARGFDVRRKALYRAEPVRTFPVAADELRQKRIDGALLFSPRTAKSFVSLAESAGLVATMSNLYAYCLSVAVAERIAHVQWRNVRVASEPTQAALLECIAADLDPPTGPQR